MTDFEKFVNGLQWLKGFDAEHDAHMESALIIFGSVDQIENGHNKNLDSAFKNVSLSGLIGSLLAENFMIEEIATHCFIDPQTIYLYYNSDHCLYYAVIIN